MNKQEFLGQLRNGLNGLPQEEIEERVIFYSEMIDDRMEEGLSEEEAVGAIGNIDSIVSQAIVDIPLSKCIKEKITPKKKLSAAEIILLLITAPILLSLLISLVSAVVSVYAALWVVIIALWAVFGSIVACGFSFIFSGIGFIWNSHGVTGMAIIGSGITGLGISIYLFFGCKIATKFMIMILDSKIF